MEYQGLDLIDNRKLDYEPGVFDDLVVLVEWDHPTYTFQKRWLEDFKTMFILFEKNQHHPFN